MLSPAATHRKATLRPRTPRERAFFRRQSGIRQADDQKLFETALTEDLAETAAVVRCKRAAAPVATN